MLIGNRHRLGFEINPVVPTWERRYPPERAAWAGLSLWVNGTNLCRHVRSGEDHVHDKLFVPLAPLADWFVRSWPAIRHEERCPLLPSGRNLHDGLRKSARLALPEGVDEDTWFEWREAWWSRHFVASGADGAHVPNLAFARDDEQMVMAWAPPRFAGSTPPKLTDDSGVHAVPWAEGEDIVADFVREVSRCLEEEGLADIYAWVGQAQPLRARPGEHDWQPLEYYTVRTVQDLLELVETSRIEDVAQFLGLAGPEIDPASSPLSQVLRDLPRHPAPDARSALAELGRRIAQSGAIPNDLADIRRRFEDAIWAAESPELAGQDIAAAVRVWLGLDTRPIVNVDDVFGRLGVELIDDRRYKGHTERMIVGWQAAGHPVTMILDTPRTRRTWGKRFEAIRGLGHLLMDRAREGAVGAASSPVATEHRRRRSGAFAAEFLLPEGALGSASHGCLDGAADPKAFRAMMDEYGVGAHTAACQLYNRGWLSSEEVRDNLVDEFGAGSSQPGV